MTLATVNVTGTVQDGNEVPVVGAKIVAQLTTNLTDGTILYAAPDPISTTTASDGTWSLAVIPNDSTLTPSGSAWSFTIFNGSTVVLSAVVQVSTADAPSVALLSLTQLATTPPLDALYVSSIIAGTGITIDQATGAVTINATGGGGGGAVSSVFTRTGAVVAASGDYTVAEVTGAAPLASPALTGTPTAPTAAALTSDTQLSTTAYADLAVGVETSRAETAEALKAPLASPVLTGTPTAPTAAALTDNTQLSTTAYTDSAVGVEKTRAEAAEALLAPLASPAFNGSPTAPTQTAGDNTTKIATDAFVTSAVSTETTRAEAAEALKAPLASPTFTGTTTAPEFSASGLTGAVAASRYVGGTASGAPTTGTFAIGDFVIDQTAAIWICTAAGTPGTWVEVGGSAGTAAFAFGTAAARPAAAAGNKNTGYYATDTGEITFSDGTSWHVIESTSATVFTMPSGGKLYTTSGEIDFNNPGYGTFLNASGGYWKSNAALDITSAGHGLMVAEGTNAKQGVATLVAGTVTVANTSVTATSRIMLTGQSDGGTVGFHRVSARTAGTSFTITSSSGTDTSVVAYEIFEVG